MPPKKKGNRNKKAPDTGKRELVFKEEMEEYGKVKKLMGDRRLKVALPDGSECISTIRGCFGKRCWMKEGDLVLTQQRPYQLDKLDIIYKYTGEEANTLYKLGHIPFSFLISEISADTSGDIVQFDNSSDDELFGDEQSQLVEAPELSNPEKELPPVDNDVPYFNPIASKLSNNL